MAPAACQGARLRVGIHRLEPLDQWAKAGVLIDSAPKSSTGWSRPRPSGNTGHSRPHSSPFV
jgi:hypothetical protein